jgi:hypothetical protein
MDVLREAVIRAACNVLLDYCADELTCDDDNFGCDRLCPICKNVLKRYLNTIKESL